MLSRWSLYVGFQFQDGDLISWTLPNMSKARRSSITPKNPSHTCKPHKEHHLTSVLPGAMCRICTFTKCHSDVNPSVTQSHFQILSVTLIPYQRKKEGGICCFKCALCLNCRRMRSMSVCMDWLYLGRSITHLFSIGEIGWTRNKSCNSLILPGAFSSLNKNALFLLLWDLCGS